MNTTGRSRVLLAGATAGVVLAATLLASGVAADTGPTPSPSPSPSSQPSSEPSSEPTPDPSASPSTGPSASASPDVTSIPSPSTLVPTQNPDAARYLVIVDNGAYTASVKQRAYELGVAVTSEFNGVIDGFAAELTPQQAAELSVAAGVDYLERDKVVTIGSAVVTPTGCLTNSLGNIDDGGTGSVSLGFSVNWFGTSYNSVLINNNGGLSLNDNQGTFREFTGIDLATTNRPLIMPLFTDIDTRATVRTVTFGTVADLGADFGNKPGFCVNWVEVGEYSPTASSTAKFSAQLLIVDQGSGNVDIVFNYNKVLAPTSSTNGKFVIGYADPANRANSRIIATSSTNPTTLTDTGSSPLKNGSSGSAVAGRYVYQIRPGASPTATPSPSATPSPTPTASCPSSVPAGTQGCAPWGLDRLDQRDLPLDQLFTPAGTGANVIAYVVDTGIRTTHTEFTGRTASGYSAITGDPSTDDCQGHGTHVAGTIAGTTYGVAKGATVVPIRVLDCSGSGYTSWVISGLDWIRTNHATNFPGKRAVVNMSLGGGATKSLDDAVAALVAVNIPVVVAAGNSSANAANFSPAREPSAITVAASASNDAQASFSNFGSLVDIYAPGVGVISAGRTSDTAAATFSGTSMSAPHVAGAVAVYLALNATHTSAQVASALVESATPNKITSLGSGSPNKLLYARAFTAPADDSSSAPPSSAPPAAAPVPSSGGGSSGGGSSAPGSGGGAVVDDEITVTQPPITTNQVRSNGEFKVVDAAGRPVTLSAAGLTPNGLVVSGSGWQIASSGPLTSTNTTLRPGQMMTIRGSGLQRLTTTGIYILSQPTWVGAGIVSYENEFQTSFMVPALPPGQHTLQINTVRQGQSPVSIAVGFTLEAGTVSTTSAESSAAAKSLFIPFAAKSAALTPTAKKRLVAAMTGLGVAAPSISLTGFSTASASAASVRLANSRMRAISTYLTSMGFGQSVSVTPAKAVRPAQARGVLLRANG